MCIEQLTLDFEYLINEVIRNDAVWGSQFCSFSDYDVVILEVMGGAAVLRVSFLFSHSAALCCVGSGSVYSIHLSHREVFVKVL